MRTDRHEVERACVNAVRNGGAFWIDSLVDVVLRLIAEALAPSPKLRRSLDKAYPQPQGYAERAQSLARQFEALRRESADSKAPCTVVAFTTGEMTIIQAALEAFAP